MVRAIRSGRIGLYNKIVVSAATLSLCGVFMPTVHASPVTFAQFQEATTGSGSPNLFTYSTTGTTSSAGTAKLTASAPVTFSYQSIPGLPADLTGPLAATLTLTAATAGAEGSPFAGFGLQAFNSQTSDTLSIALNTPVNNGYGPQSNLLTMKFTGTLGGFLNGFAAQLTGQTANSASIAYSSDFLVLGSSVEDYTVNFTSWTSSDSNGLEAASSGFFQNATAAGTGTFDDGSVSAVAPIPEPVTSMLAAAAFGSIILRRRPKSV